MVLLDFASPSALDRYRDHIKQYAARFGSDCWALLYQTDTRARREFAARIRRRAIRESPAGFVLTRPWEYVFKAIPREFEFWKKRSSKTRAC